MQRVSGGRRLMGGRARGRRLLVVGVATATVTAAAAAAEAVAEAVAVAETNTRLERVAVLATCSHTQVECILDMHMD